MFFSFFAMHFSSANIVCEGQVLKVRHLSAGYPCLSSHSTGPPVCFFIVQEEELYACQRGCRLFSICQFVRDSEDLNQTKSECESSKLCTDPVNSQLCCRRGLLTNYVLCS